MLAFSCGAGDTPLGGPFGGKGRLLGPTDGGYDNVDATFTPPLPQTGSIPGTPGSWTHVYFAYLAEGTIGNCYPCHIEMVDPPASFRWLEEHAYVGDGAPLLTSTQSCLTWFGGNMPPGSPVQSAEAVNEMNLWVSSGALNN